MPFREGDEAASQTLRSLDGGDGGGGMSAVCLQHRDFRAGMEAQRFSGQSERHGNISGAGLDRTASVQAGSGGGKAGKISAGSGTCFIGGSGADIVHRQFFGDGRRDICTVPAGKEEHGLERGVSLRLRTVEQGESRNRYRSSALSGGGEDG